MPTVDSLDIQITTSATSANKALDKLASTIAGVQRQLGKTTSVSGFNSLRTTTSRLNNDLVKTQKVSKNTAAGFTKMAISARALRVAIEGIGKSIKSSMDYIETLNYFNNAWAQVAEKADLSAFEDLGYESAEAFANSFSERAKQVTSELTGFNIMPSGELVESGKVSLGIDPNQVLNYQAMFGQMASSIGLTSENSLLLSEALTKIGADLASVKNMDFDKVWQDMASGLAGMSRTLDKYGVNIRNVNLQQKLFDLGINANIANLNQNDKAMLRTIILLESTGYAYGDLAETINAPSNQLRLLKANFTNLARTIGNLFLPVVQTVLPYINGLVIALQRLFTWVGSLLGIDFSSITDSISSAGGSDYSDLIGDTEDVSDNLDDASKSAKKMKDYLLGIDELNVIKPEEESGTDALSGIGASGGLLDDAFKNAIDEYLKAWDEAFANLENRANEIADKIQAFALKVWNAIEPFRIALKQLWDEGLSKLANFTWTALEDFYEEFLKPLGEWAFGEEDKGLTAFVNTLNDLLNNIDWEALNSALKDLWIALEPFVEKVGDGLNWFFREVLSPLAQFLANSILVDAIEALANAFEILNDVIEVLAPIVRTFWEEFGKEAYAETLEKIASAVDSLLAPFESLSDLLEDFSWDNFLKYAKDVAEFALLLTNPIAYFSTVKPEEKYEQHQSANEQYHGGGGAERKEKTGSLDILKDNFNQFFEDIGTSATTFFDELYANKLQEFVTNTSTKFSEWYENSVKPWFSAEKWEELWGSIKTSAETKWNELVTWWNESALVKWWTDEVSPWFTTEKWSELYSTIKTELENKWTEVVEWWNSSGIYRWYNNNVKNWFAKDKWTFSGIKEGLVQAWENAIEGIKNVWNKFASWFNEKMSIELPSLEIDGKKIFEGKTIEFIKLPTFATGGFPEDGLFMANHGELVGKFSNGRTAVANNDMITTGIENAVYRGFSMAYSENNREVSLLEELIVAVREGKSITIDGRELVEAYDSRKTRNGFAF